MSFSCLHRWTIPHYSRGRQQEDRARGAAGPSTHPTLERRQPVPVVPAQAGRPPRGHAASVCEEGKAVQSGCLGPDRWKWLAAHPNHIMGHRSGKCKYNDRHVREVESYVVNLKSLQIFLTVWRRNVCSYRSEQQSEFQKNGTVRIFRVETQWALFPHRAACVSCSSVQVSQCAPCCCSPGDPEGGAWARQERRDGCGRHHPEERLLHRGAQSEETLTDRAERGREKNKRENHLKENWLCCDNPSLSLGAHWLTPTPTPPPPLPAIVRTISEKLCFNRTVGFCECPWIKRLNLI